MFSISKTERSQDFIKHQIFLPHEEIRSPHSKEKGSNFHKDSLNLSLANVSVLNFRSMNKMYNPILLTIVFKLSKINLSSAMGSQNWNICDFISPFWFEEFLFKAYGWQKVSFHFSQRFSTVLGLKTGWCGWTTNLPICLNFYTTVTERSCGEKAIFK